jgi:hypothetical protein
MNGAAQRVTRFAARALLAVAAIEIPAAGAAYYFDRLGLFYRSEDTSRFRVYMAERDPDLGWVVPRGSEGERMDASGARHSPAFPDPLTPACISLYGDSFTWGAEVEDEPAWGNVLARRVGCRVANYGVPGYGTDQAFIRFHNNHADHAPVVLLGIYSENVARNVNTYRRLLSGRFAFGLKPRFELDDAGELRLVPLLEPTEPEMRALTERPEDRLKHEWFVPGGPSGITRRTFPYSLSLLRLFREHRVVAAMRREPHWTPLYDPAHPSRALPITAAIVRAFAREARARGAFAGVVLIPDPGDFPMKRHRGRSSYTPLLEALDRDGVPYLDTIDLFAQKLGDREPFTLYTGRRGGHFNEASSAALAGFVHDWLRAQGRLPSGAPDRRGPLPGGPQADR